MKRKCVFVGLAGLVAIVLGLTGCEWTTGGGVDDWVNVGYNWANFSGNYRAPDGRVLVRQFGHTNLYGNISTTNSSHNESIGTGDGIKTEFSGFLRGSPIPGTLTIIVGSYRFTDSAANNNMGTYTLKVDPPDGSIGTINYPSRLWSLKFPAPIAAGTPIKATYMYLVHDDGQGNHGKAIYSFVVHHTGNLLRLVDNNGVVYEGNIGDMNTTGGHYDASDPSSVIPEGGRVFAQFSASGHSAGYAVTITGALQGDFSATDNKMVSRRMDATFIEAGGYTADINAVAAD
ncbi:MAG: hypothetical protein ACOYCD_06595 [Kiritimatiellia bacterium]|jgi:hypothetical protein